jgi:hypothetical protein
VYAHVESAVHTEIVHRVYGLGINAGSVDVYIRHSQILQLHCWLKTDELRLVWIELESPRCTPMVNGHDTVLKIIAACTK